MKWFIASLFTLSPTFLLAALDTGSGGLGACTEATFIQNTRSYECTSLTVNNSSVFNNVVTSGSAVIIKVQGTVTINGTLSLNGGNGTDATTNGGNPGAGGFKGGDSQTTGPGLDGLGSGGGKGGSRVFDGVSNSIGGGGGGAGHNSTSAATDGADGDLGGAPNVGSKGLKGSSYQSENQFESSFVGGSGGGAAGAGYNSSTNIRGATGGGGGGAIRIIAGGDITINGTIEANGGDGGTDGGTTGSGGAGSGGSIWLQTNGNITGNGTIKTLGGTGGVGLGSGDGGNGAKGRIRLDDSDGIVTTLTLDPTAQINDVDTINTTTNSANQEIYRSDITCSTMPVDLEKQTNFQFLIGLLLGMSLIILSKIKINKRDN